MHIHLTQGSELRQGGWRGCLRSHAAHSDMWTFVCLKGRVNLEATLWDELCAKEQVSELKSETCCTIKSVCACVSVVKISERHITGS